MVLHFANSLERSPKIMEVDIAGFLLAVWLRQVCWKCDYGATFLYQPDSFFRIADLGKVNVEKTMT